MILHHRSHRTRSARVSSVESLEPRRLLSAASPVSLHNGLLKITGTPNDDVIRVGLGAASPPDHPVSYYEVNFNGTTYDFPAIWVKKIQINAGAGNDKVSLCGDRTHTLPVATGILGEVLVNATIFGGEGNDIICGGNGNDLIFGGAGDDVLNGWAGRDTVLGGAGNDTFGSSDHPDLGAGIRDGGAGNDTFMNGRYVDDVAISGGTGTNTFYCMPNVVQHLKPTDQVLRA